MAVTTEKYVRRPLYVDAVRVTHENFEDLAVWCQGDIGVVEAHPDTKFIRIRVHNPQSPRQTRAFVGDWILYTERGYKIYTDKAFRENFSLADEKGVTEAS